MVHIKMSNIKITNILKSVKNDQIFSKMNKRDIKIIKSREKVKESIIN